MFVRGITLAIFLGSFTPTALAQTGILDQFALPSLSGIYSTGPSVVLQQEVHAGIPGQLEGFQFTASAGSGAQYGAGIRMGPGCTTTPLVFSTVVTTTGSGPQQSVFVDCTSANIAVVTGTVFVIEIFQLTSGYGLVGSGQPPLYPHALFVLVTGQGCNPHSLQLRLAFATYVLSPPSQPTYCVGKANSAHCLPSIATYGTPSATAPDGFTVRSVLMRNQSFGLLLYTNAGRAALPFQGGTLCLAAPIRRSVPMYSGGSLLPASDCSGVYAIDFNAFARGVLGGAPAAYLGISGTTVDAQFWGRDQGFPAPNDSALSNAVEYTVP